MKKPKSDYYENDIYVYFVGKVRTEFVCVLIFTLFITDKIPDDEHFQNGSKNRQSWEADDIGDTNRNDPGMLSYTHGHVKFDTPRVPVIFVLGKNKVAITPHRVSNTCD